MTDTNGASSSKGKEKESNVEELEKILSREAAAFQRDLEVHLNPFYYDQNQMQRCHAG